MSESSDADSKRLIVYRVQGSALSFGLRALRHNPISLGKIKSLGPAFSRKTGEGEGRYKTSAGSPKLKRENLFTISSG